MTSPEVPVTVEDTKALQLLTNIFSYMTIIYGEVAVKDAPHLLDMTIKALQAAREEALEEAAKVAEESFLDTSCKQDSHCGTVADYAAKKIRALKAGVLLKMENIGGK